MKDLNDPTNRDSVPAMLTPGEFVLNKEASQMFKAQIEQMNQAGLQQRDVENKNMGGMIPHYNEGGSLPTLPTAYNTGGLVGFLKEQEGYRDKAYKDSGGVYTIGYGRTKNPDGSPVREGQSTQQADEDSWLDQRAGEDRSATEAYGKKHGYNWNPQQTDALSSFRYNVGNLDQLTKGGTRSMEEIQNYLPQYNKAGGEEVDGLSNRRGAELALFNSQGQAPQQEVPTQEAPPPVGGIKGFGKDLLNQAGGVEGLTKAGLGAFLGEEQQPLQHLQGRRVDAGPEFIPLTGRNHGGPIPYNLGGDVEPPKPKQSANRSGQFNDDQNYDVADLFWQNDRWVDNPGVPNKHHAKQFLQKAQEEGDVDAFKTAARQFPNGAQALAFSGDHPNISKNLTNHSPQTVNDYTTEYAGSDTGVPLSLGNTWWDSYDASEAQADEDNLTGKERDEFLRNAESDADYESYQKYQRAWGDSPYNKDLSTQLSDNWGDGWGVTNAFGKAADLPLSQNQLRGGKNNTHRGNYASGYTGSDLYEAGKFFNKNDGGPIPMQHLNIGGALKSLFGGGADAIAKQNLRATHEEKKNDWVPFNEKGARQDVVGFNKQLRDLKNQPQQQVVPQSDGTAPPKPFSDEALQQDSSQAVEAQEADALAARQRETQQRPISDGAVRGLEADERLRQMQAEEQAYNAQQQRYVQEDAADYNQVGGFLGQGDSGYLAGQSGVPYIPNGVQDANQVAGFLGQPTQAQQQNYGPQGGQGQIAPAYGEAVPAIGTQHGRGDVGLSDPGGAFAGGFGEIPRGPGYDEAGVGAGPQAQSNAIDFNDPQFDYTPEEVGQPTTARGDARQPQTFTGGRGEVPIIPEEGLDAFGGEGRNIPPPAPVDDFGNVETTQNDRDVLASIEWAEESGDTATADALRSTLPSNLQGDQATTISEGAQANKPIGETPEALAASEAALQERMANATTNEDYESAQRAAVKVGEKKRQAEAHVAKERLRTIAKEEAEGNKEVERLERTIKNAKTPTIEAAAQAELDAVVQTADSRAAEKAEILETGTKSAQEAGGSQHDRPAPKPSPVEAADAVDQVVNSPEAIAETTAAPSPMSGQGNNPGEGTGADTAEEAGKKAAPEAKKAGFDAVKKAFGSLLDNKELLRMGVLFAGSLAVGATPAQALQFAGRNYMDRVDAKEAGSQKHIQKLVTDAKHTPSSIEAYKKSGDSTDLIPTGTTPERSGTFKTLYGPKGSVKVEEVKFGDQVKYLDENDKIISQFDYSDNASSVDYTPEGREAQQKESKEYAGIFKEAQDAVIASNKEGDYPGAKTSLLPKAAGNAAAKWARDNGVPPAGMGQLIRNAYDSAQRDGKSAKSILPYLNDQFVQANVGDTSNFQTSDGKTVEAQKTNQWLNVIGNGLKNKNPAFKNQSPARISQFVLGSQANKDWNALDGDTKSTWAKQGKSKGYSGWMMYMQNQM